MVDVRRDEVAELLYGIAVGYKHLLVDVAASLGLHPTDVDALQVLLAADEPPAVQQLGARLGLSSGAVTGLVDRLEASGHARRVRDPDDRRRVIVEAAPHSRPDVIEALGSHLSALGRLVDEFDDDEVAVVVRFLRGLLHALEAGAGSGGHDDRAEAAT